MSDDTFPAPTDAEMTALNSMLGDAAVWAEPSPDVEDRVLAAIMAEADLGKIEDRETEDQTASEVIDLEERRARRGGAGRFWPLAAVAAVLIAVGAGAALINSGQSDPSLFTVAMAPTEFAPGASATARIDERPNGAQLIIELSGLEPAPPGFFYEVWLVKEEPRTVISAGTFHMRGSDVGEIEFWAGVSTEFYKTVTITLESEADPSAAGELILKGEILP